MPETTYHDTVPLVRIPKDVMASLDVAAYHWLGGVPMDGAARSRQHFLAAAEAAWERVMGS